MSRAQYSVRNGKRNEIQLLLDPYAFRWAEQGVVGAKYCRGSCHWFQFPTARLLARLITSILYRNEMTTLFLRHVERRLRADRHRPTRWLADLGRRLFRTPSPIIATWSTYRILSFLDSRNDFNPLFVRALLFFLWRNTRRPPSFLGQFVAITKCGRSTFSMATNLLVTNEIGCESIQ